MCVCVHIHIHVCICIYAQRKTEFSIYAHHIIPFHISIEIDGNWS